jgi:hypothetical protein
MTTDGKIHSSGTSSSAAIVRSRENIQLERGLPRASARAMNPRTILSVFSVAGLVALAACAAPPDPEEASVESASTSGGFIEGEGTCPSRCEPKYYAVVLAKTKMDGFYRHYFKHGAYVYTDTAIDFNDVTPARRSGTTPMSIEWDWNYTIGYVTKELFRAHDFRQFNVDLMRDDNNNRDEDLGHCHTSVRLENIASGTSPSYCNAYGRRDLHVQSVDWKVRPAWIVNRGDNCICTVGEPPEPKEFDCPTLETCNGLVTGTPDQVVCGKSGKRIKCTPAGWNETSEGCGCAPPEQPAYDCPSLETCSGTAVGSPDQYVCGKNLKRVKCTERGWNETSEDCTCEP